MAFSINITLDTVLGAIVSVLVVVRVALEVTLRYIALAGSAAASATVVVEFASVAKPS